MTSPPYTRAGLQDALQSTRFGHLVEWHSSLPSTNDEARRRAEQGAPEGLLVVAEVQTAGRGRLGRPWSSPPGGLWFSLVLRPPAGEMSLLSFVFAAAACRAIEAVADRSAVVDWPNDVVLPPTYKKSGGVLLESRQAYRPSSASQFDWIVAGVGLDAGIDVAALDADAREVAQSISDVDIRVPLLARTLLEMELVYDAIVGGRNSIERIRAESRCRTVGERVRIAMPGETLEGQAEGVEAEGALRVRLDDGTQRIIWSCDRCQVLT